MRIVVVGGAGFIGSAICRSQVARHGATVLNIDKLTPASSLASLAPVASSPRYVFRRADICDRERIAALLQAFAPDAIVHAAAERDAGDRMGSAAAAVETNLVGTWRLLEAARTYWSGLPEQRRVRFRFLSVSSAAAPAGPVSASRIAADALVLAWHSSYGLPAMVSKAVATFGPCQFPGEPVPDMVFAAINRRSEPVGDGAPREWLYLEDHVRALELMLEKGTPGATYTVAGSSGRVAPAAIAQRIASLVARHGSPRKPVHSPTRLAQNAPDPQSNPGLSPSRDGEIVDSSRLECDTGWQAAETLGSGLSKTVRWYLANEAWWRPLQAAQSAGQCHGLLRTA